MKKERKVYITRCHLHNNIISIVMRIFTIDICVSYRCICFIFVGTLRPAAAKLVLVSPVSATTPMCLAAEWGSSNPGSSIRGITGFSGRVGGRGGGKKAGAEAVKRTFQRQSRPTFVCECLVCVLFVLAYSNRCKVTAPPFMPCDVM